MGGRGPEFAHDNIAVAEILDGIEGAGVRAAGLRLDLHIIFVAVFGEDFIVIVGDTISERFAEIRQEGVADIAVFDNLAREDRQVRNRIVKPVFHEIGGKFRAPVHSAAFPTVGFKLLQRRAGQRPGFLQKRLDNFLPITVEGVPAEVIEYVPMPVDAVSRNVGISYRIPESQHCPVAFGYRPFERSIRSHLSGNIANIAEQHILL